MLDHAIATWTRAGEEFEDYADFERDGFRCTVPACSARRSLQSRHVRFLSAGGHDEPWNRFGTYDPWSSGWRRAPPC